MHCTSSFVYVNTTFIIVCVRSALVPIDPILRAMIDDGPVLVSRSVHGQTNPSINALGNEIRAECAHSHVRSTELPQRNLLRAKISHSHITVNCTMCEYLDGLYALFLAMPHPHCVVWIDDPIAIAPIDR